MRIDLDGLERRIISDHNARMSRAQSLALIARIRELEEALNDALAYTIPGDERDRLVQVLAEWPKVKEGK